MADTLFLASCAIECWTVAEGALVLGQGVCQDAGDSGPSLVGVAQHAAEVAR